MDIEERYFEALAELPLQLTPVRDAEHLEGLNTLVTLDTPDGRVELVLTGAVADPDRYFEALSKKRAGLVDVDVCDRPATTDITPREFLAAMPGN